MTPEKAAEQAAVMAAWAADPTRKLQCRLWDNPQGPWATLTAAPVWSFGLKEYRLAPTPKLRPWQPEEVPVGAVIRPKDSTINVYVIAFRSFEFVYVAGLGDRTHMELFDYFVMLDGSPCGVMEDGE